MQYRLVALSRCVLVLMSVGNAGYGHDAITTKVTFDREVIRLVISHCGSCHHAGGSSWNFMTYDSGNAADPGARPWAKDLGEEVLQRRMPPWGAVKGFGDFRNDKGLTEEQLELIVDWEEGGAPEGDPKDIPATIKFPVDPPVKHPPGEVMISGDTRLAKPLILDGLWAKSIPDGASYQVTAEFPDGGIEPLIWFQNYKNKFDHPFLLRRPLTLPEGTYIRGVPAGDTLLLMPAKAPGGKIG